LKRQGRQGGGVGGRRGACRKGGTTPSLPTGPSPPRRSSNRTCGFPASGSRTAFPWRLSAMLALSATASLPRSSSRLLELSGFRHQLARLLLARHAEL